MKINKALLLALALLPGAAYAEDAASDQERPPDGELW